MRLLAVFPMAERRTTGLSLSLVRLRTRSATLAIRLADASDDPSNFITVVNPVAAFSPSGSSAAAALSSFLRHRTPQHLFPLEPAARVAGNSPAPQIGKERGYFCE